METIHSVFSSHCFCTKCSTAFFNRSDEKDDCAAAIPEIQKNAIKTIRIININYRFKFVAVAKISSAVRTDFEFNS